MRRYMHPVSRCSLLLNLKLKTIVVSRDRKEKHSKQVAGSVVVGPTPSGSKTKIES